MEGSKLRVSDDWERGHQSTIRDSFFLLLTLGGFFFGLLGGLALFLGLGLPRLEAEEVLVLVEIERLAQIRVPAADTG